MNNISRTLIFSFIALLCLATLATAEGISSTEGYRIPLVKGDIDVGKVNLVQTFQFVNERNGNHSIGISFNKLPKGNFDFRTAFEAEVSIFDGSKLLKYTYVNKPTGLFSGCYNKIGGFYLLWYKVPNDLPAGVPLNCTIRITRGDSEFESTYGKGEFFIIKESDK